MEKKAECGKRPLPLRMRTTHTETHGRFGRHMNQEEVEKKSEAIHGKSRVGGQSHANFERG